jgi:hypothetical protein
MNCSAEMENNRTGNGPQDLLGAQQSAHLADNEGAAALEKLSVTAEDRQCAKQAATMNKRKHGHEINHELCKDCISLRLVLRGGGLLLGRIGGLWCRRIARANLSNDFQGKLDHLESIMLPSDLHPIRNIQC